MYFVLFGKFILPVMEYWINPDPQYIVVLFFMILYKLVIFDAIEI